MSECPGSIPRSNPDSSFLPVYILGKQQMRIQVDGSLLPNGRPGFSSQLLASTSIVGRYVGRKPVNGSLLSHTDALSLPLK